MDESKTVVPDLKKVQANPKTKINKDVEVVETDTEKKIIKVTEAPPKLKTENFKTKAKEASEV